MKTIQVILEWTKDGYGVWIEELPNIFSFGKTVEEAKMNVRKAIEYAFEDKTEKPMWLTEGFEIAVKFDTIHFAPCFFPPYRVTPH